MPPFPQAVSCERSRALEISRLYRLKGVEGERADGSRGLVAAVLRKGARADDEHVRHVPALQVLVHRARRRLSRRTHRQFMEIARRARFALESRETLRAAHGPRGSASEARALARGSRALA